MLDFHLRSLQVSFDPNETIGSRKAFQITPKPNYRVADCFDLAHVGVRLLQFTSSDWLCPDSGWINGFPGWFPGPKIKSGNRIWQQVRFISRQSTFYIGLRLGNDLLSRNLHSKF